MSHLQISTADPSMTNQHLLFNVPNEILSYPLNSLFENYESVNFSSMMKVKQCYHNITCGSCNGLLCLYDTSQHCVRLFNPSIKWISKKSPEAFSHGWMIIYYGFGYDQVNDKYKVLVVVENKSENKSDSRRERLTKIYTFGGEEDSWKTIQKFPCTSTVPLGEFVSGTLNWMVDNGGVSSNQTVILSFDLEKETYREVLLPQNDTDNVSMHRLYVLNNCLCVFSETNKTHWVAWLMKEYGVVDSWTKLMIIPHDKFPSNYPSFVDPLFVSKNGVVLLLDEWSNRLVLYNMYSSGRLDYLSISSMLGHHLHIYHESLISPP
jgi:F-box interacting protein